MGAITSSAFAVSPSDCSSTQFFNPFTQSCVSCSESFISGRYSSCGNGSLTCKLGYYQASIYWILSGNTASQYLFCQECPDRYDVENKIDGVNATSMYGTGAWGSNSDVATRCRYSVTNVTESSGCKYTLSNVPNMNSGSNCISGKHYTNVSFPSVQSTYGNPYSSYDLHAYCGSCEAFSCDHIVTKTYTYVPGNYYVTNNGTSSAQCKPCASGTWSVSGSGDNVPTECQTVPENAHVKSDGGWECDGIYYLSGNQCEKCPYTGGSVTWGMTTGLKGAMECYLVPGSSFQDDTGDYTNNAACYYSGSVPQFYYRVLKAGNSSCSTCYSKVIEADGCSYNCGSIANAACNSSNAVLGEGYSTKATLLKVLSTNPSCAFYVGEGPDSLELVVNHGQ